MKPVSRRDMLKAGLLVPAAAAAHGLGPIGAAAIQAAQKEPASLPIGEATDAAKPGAGRERLLLDFGWRFHFGNADDATKDFGFGAGQSGNFQKTGNFMPAGGLLSTTVTGRASICPMTGRSSCLSQMILHLTSKGFYPLGRNYPATSVGWYRRVFDFPAEDAGKRITVEFDGAYRETMVVLQRLLHRPAQRRV